MQTFQDKLASPPTLALLLAEGNYTLDIDVGKV